MTVAAPLSPCINVCTLDALDVCRGCYRNLAEITAWGRLTAEQQWRVVRAAENRRTAERERRQVADRQASSEDIR